jgi:adenylate cyclase
MQALRRLSSYVQWIQKSKEHALIIICGITLTCVVAYLYLCQPLLLSTLDLKIYDALLKSRPGRTASDSIVIVAIDTKRLAQFGQWPWPRYRTARLIDKLREMGALSVGVDILFAEPDRSSLRNIQKTISADFGHTVNLAGVPQQYIDNDAMLVEALRKGPFVLGYQFLFGDRIEKICTLYPVNVLIRKKHEIPDSENGLFKVSSVDCIYQPLAEATPASGFFNIKPNHDGILRRVPLIMEYNGRFYAHLFFAILLSAVKPEHMVLTVGQAGTESLSIDDVEIPLQNKGFFLIPFHGPHGTYRYISAADILKGTTETREIEGHIVIIGAVAPGLLDIHATPTDPTMAGVEVHANIIDAIL